MGMFDSFKNTPKNYIPNNMYDTDWDATNEITRGADCDHIFVIEGDYTVIAKSFKAIIRQNCVQIIKKGEDLDIKLINGNTYVRTHLKPEDTLPFDYRYHAFSQLEIKLVSDDIIYSKINEVEVINSLPLENTKFKPYRENVESGE